MDKESLQKTRENQWVNSAFSKTKRPMVRFLLLLTHAVLGKRSGIPKIIKVVGKNSMKTFLLTNLKTWRNCIHIQVRLGLKIIRMNETEIQLTEQHHLFKCTPHTHYHISHKMHCALVCHGCQQGPGRGGPGQGAGWGPAAHPPRAWAMPSILPVGRTSCWRGGLRTCRPLREGKRLAPKVEGDPFSMTAQGQALDAK